MGVFVGGNEKRRGEKDEEKTQEVALVLTGVGKDFTRWEQGLLQPQKTTTKMRADSMGAQVNGGGGGGKWGGGWGTEAPLLPRLER